MLPNSTVWAKSFIDQSRQFDKKCGRSISRPQKHVSHFFIRADSWFPDQDLVVTRIEILQSYVYNNPVYLQHQRVVLLFRGSLTGWKNEMTGASSSSTEEMQNPAFGEE